MTPDPTDAGLDELEEAWHNGTMDLSLDAVGRLFKFLRACRQDLRAMAEALEPFCGPGGGADMQAFHDIPNDVVVWENSGAGVTAGDVRQAREVLAKYQGGPVCMMNFRKPITKPIVHLPNDNLQCMHCENIYPNEAFIALHKRMEHQSKAKDAVIEAARKLCRLAQPTASRDELDRALAALDKES